MTVEPNIHPAQDSADQLLRDMSGEFEKLARRFADQRVEVRTTDRPRFLGYVDRYRRLQRQQGDANWRAAIENGRD